ncbi:MAG: type II toxin-antitoxin system MqsR family toxin [Peptococcaceae bacterium]|nr:type II toxin-antitoxin system MqsR family toxin [Peptococcaceae bacterium]
MSLSPPDAIETFLQQVRRLIDIGRFDLVIRKETRAAMVALGFSSKWEVAAVVKNLAVSDYAEGPCPDDNPNHTGDIWVFGPEIEGNQYYLKIKVRDRPEVVCLSFHIPKWPLRCPYRK